MTVSTNAPSGAAKSVERRAAGVAFSAHALHDGYTDLIYLMLPIWQAEFGLGYAALGLLRGLFTGAMASLQIPSGFLAERFGAPLILALGTALAGIGYIIAGTTTGVITLLIALGIAGTGSSTQHPLASTLIARAFSGARSRTALGTYNFAGDIGKMLVPLAASVMLVVLPWRTVVVLLGGLGVIAAVAIFIVSPRFSGDVEVVEKATKAKPARVGRFAFPLLLSIGVIDSATRMAFLTFLPFILTAKGASIATIGVALTLVFAGGAVGKIVCAFIGARVGTVMTVVITEVVTAVAIVALLPATLDVAMVMLPIIGIALNGTSSVLYGSVPDLVEPEKRARAFGIFYTGTIGAGAVSPLLYGLVGDAMGITTTIIAIATMALITLPITIALRPALPAKP